MFILDHFFTAGEDFLNSKNDMNLPPETKFLAERQTMNFWVLSAILLTLFGSISTLFNRKSTV